MSSTHLRLEDSPAFYEKLARLDQEAAWVEERLRGVLSCLQEVANASAGGGRTSGSSLGVEDGAPSLAQGLIASARLIGSGLAGWAGRPEPVTSEAKLAVALESLTVPESENDALSEPLGHLVGAPLLQPLATALHMLSGVRESQGVRLHQVVCVQLEQYLEDLRLYRIAYENFETRKEECDAARASYLAIPSSGVHEVGHSQAASALEDAKLSLEAARGALVAALATVNGKRRYILISAIVDLIKSLQSSYRQALDVLEGLVEPLEQAQTYVEHAKVKAEEAFMSQAQAVAEHRLNNLEEEEEYSHKEKDSTGHDAAFVVESISQSMGRSQDSRLRAAIAAAKQSSSAVQVAGEVARLSSLGQEPILEGHLLVRESTGLREHWERRYFILQSSGHLIMLAEERDSGSSFLSLLETAAASWIGRGSKGDRKGDDSDPIALAPNSRQRLCLALLTSTVKLGTGSGREMERPFCFRVISPTQTLTLQAEGERERSQWVDAVQGMVAELLNARATATSAETDNNNVADEIRKIRAIKGNDVCADCGAADPDWASLNLGVLICQQCAGAHRYLGVQHSKVRSLALDMKSWTPDVLALFLGLGGNVSANRIWEASLAENDDDDSSGGAVAKITSEARTEDRRAFAHAKYVERRFIDRSAKSIPVLSKVVTEGSLGELLHCIALGLDLNEERGSPMLAASRVCNGPLSDPECMHGQS
mmetsp:Transcript_5612/g.20408  ORF Transcript_5612/g.20408 Transcript_5612/m.20408 type:complete len:711 (-) Transcript_5612:620-2752(-)